jgi:exodeoxyribonuclease VII small subunit
MAKKTPLKFEDTISQLEALISKMDEEGVSLEDTLAAFEQGINCTREAQRTLEQAEQRVRLLTEKGGDRVDEPFLDIEGRE